MNIKLAWECKQWEPGLTTFRRAGGTVLVGLSGGEGATLDSGFKLSHAAAAEWAADAVGRSLVELGRALA